MVYQLDGVERRLAMPSQRTTSRMLATAAWDGDHIVITSNSLFQRDEDAIEGDLVDRRTGPSGDRLHGDRPGSRSETMKIIYVEAEVDRRLLAYWLPMVVFGAHDWLESQVPAAWFPLAYIVKAAIVTACLLIFRAPLAEIRVRRRLSCAVRADRPGRVPRRGSASIDGVPYPHLGTRTAFDPTPLQGIALVDAVSGRATLRSCLHGAGDGGDLLAFVPVAVPDPARFRHLPVGTFSASALWVMVAASALAHPEWLVAVVASLAYALWLRRTGSFFGVDRGACHDECRAGRLRARHRIVAVLVRRIVRLTIWRGWRALPTVDRQRQCPKCHVTAHALPMVQALVDVGPDERPPRAALRRMRRAPRACRR